jgi:TetR/AcrR family transcriptional regulator, fatty acid metabolism regulator protein
LTPAGRGGILNGGSFIVARRKSDDKRRRILDAAVRVFARRGYFGAKVSEIAARAGVADGTIYLYFRDKADILVSLFDEVMAEHIAAARREVAAARGAADKLRVVARRHLRLFSGNQDLAVVFQVELRQSTKFMERFTASWLQDYFEILQGVIAAGQREGVLRADVSRKLATKAFFGILDQMVTSWVLGRKDYDVGDLAEPVVDLFVRGAAREARASRPALHAVASARGGRA